MIDPREGFSCDLRSLAAFRFGLGLVILADMIARVCDLFVLEDGPGVEYLLIIFIGISSIPLLLGWGSRYLVSFTWLVLAALHLHNPLVSTAADRLLLAMLFFAIFLPLDRCYSINSAMDPLPTREYRYFSFATVLILLQVILLFSSLALEIKSATFNETFFSTLLNSLFWLAAILSVMVFLPKLQTLSRLSFIAVCIVVLLIISVPLQWQFLPAVYCVALLLFVPESFWDWLASRTELSQRGGMKIYYDQDCGFCHKICLLMRTFLLLNKTTIEPAQTDPAIYEIMLEVDSWVVKDHDNSYYTRWHAVLLLLRRSPIAWPIGIFLYKINMGYWGDFIYQLVANNRARLSTLTAVIYQRKSDSLKMGIPVKILLGLWVMASLQSYAHEDIFADLPAYQAFKIATGIEPAWTISGNNILPLPQQIQVTLIYADKTLKLFDSSCLINPANTLDKRIVQVLSSKRWSVKLVRELSLRKRTHLTETLCRTVVESIDQPRLTTIEFSWDIHQPGDEFSSKKLTYFKRVICQETTNVSQLTLPPIQR